MAQMLLLIILLTLFDASLASSTSRGFRAYLTHVDADGNYSKLQLIRRGAERSKHRAATMMASRFSSSSNSTNAVQTAVRYGSGEYIMDFSIGTPPVAYSGIADTGSDITWAQCEPCTHCFPQPTPIFDPSKSSSFSKLACNSSLCEAHEFRCGSGCEFGFSYADNSSINGTLVIDTITFDGTSQVSVPNIVFACSTLAKGFSREENISGIIGLSRGHLSFVSQLDVGKFSYCLIPVEQSKPSPFLFGSILNPNDVSNTTTQSTPLIINRHLPLFYYVPLKGITVGKTRLPIPEGTFDIKSNGDGGMVVDSGTTVTTLEDTAYNILKEELVSVLKLSVVNGSDYGLDLCFSLPANLSFASLELPELIFHFDGADLEVPKDNYMGFDDTPGIICLFINPSSTVGIDVSILGNIQQQNVHVIYDLVNEEMSFIPTQCDQL